MTLKHDRDPAQLNAYRTLPAFIRTYNETNRVRLSYKNSELQINTTMKKTNFYKAELTFCLTLIFLVLGIQNSGSQTFCIQAGSDQIAGVQDGFRYELWNQYSQGTACMTLGSGALFSGEWSGIFNYLARRGLGYNQTQTHDEIGRFYSTYNCVYNPSSETGNSYLSIYGWTVEPLVEYYIIEDWRNWIPSMAAGTSSKGSITVNGSTYDIYENTRVNQPSIQGNATFQQYFSIRRDERNSGTINISDHFDKWESLGMGMGNLYEVSFVVEGYQSSGSFNFTALDVFVNNETLIRDGASELPANIHIYPNPNSGTLSVQLDEPVSDASVKIYDASGRIIFSRESIKNNLIQVTGLQSGIYFVNVNSKSFTHTAKLLVYQPE
ncbi:MAG: glycoside hydrolase family 11 protein [Bacteroidales bacterium]|nr:glycoside hydrolase family 11 protein [Bacteroidales bacterium]